MHAKKLDAAVNKAKSKLDLKRYVYPSVHNSQQNVKSVVFTDVGEVIGVYQDGHLVSVENLSGTQKVLFLTSFFSFSFSLLIASMSMCCLSRGVISNLFFFLNFSPYFMIC